MIYNRGAVREINDLFTPAIDLSKYGVHASYMLKSIVCRTRKGKVASHYVAIAEKEDTYWLFDDLSPVPHSVSENYVQDVLNDAGEHGLYPYMLTYKIT
jgi:hypothetical protein